MKSEIYWHTEGFPGRLALLARPRGGDWLEDEVSDWARAGINVVVSMLEQSETEEFGLERETELSGANNIEFISFPVPDRGVPRSMNEFLKLARRLSTLLLAGKNVGIHCRQSVGRAPLLAASILILLHSEPDSAFRELSAIRGREIPETPEQAEWVRQIALKPTLAPT